MRLRSTPINTFLGCPRKYKIQFEDGYDPVDESRVLLFGTAFHAALEARAKGASMAESRKEFRKLADGISNNTRIVGDALVVLYYEAYRNEKLKYTGVEQSWEFELDGVNLAGRFDAVAEIDGETWIVEHKTTSSDIEAGSLYWQRKDLDLQVSLYMLAAKATGMNVAGVLYDVIRKPKLALRRATPLAKKKYRKDGALYKGQRENDETPNAYQARLMEYVVEHRDDLLRREKMYFDEKATARCVDNILQTKKLIETGARPMNTSNCYAFNQQCEYKPVCAGETGLDNERLYQLNTDPMGY